MAAEDKDLNRDPITDEPGAHPVGTGIGATGGAVAGATMGAIGGPIGVAVGGVVGAVVGGLAGKAAGEAVNPTAEEAYWKDNYSREPYYEKGRTYDDYAPAYRLGLTGRTRYDGDFETAEPRLASEWEEARAGSGLEWKQAQPASRAAWERVDSQRSGMKAGGAAAAVGSMQSAGNEGGDRDDVVDALQDLVECCKDGEYGFRACAEQAKRADLKSTFMQRADDCRGAAQELNEQIRNLGGKAEDGGSVAGAMHRGWVSVKSALTTYDDKAVLEECERGEDNAIARYRKALKQTLPAGVKLIVERQMQGVQRNHDQIKMLRDQFRAAS
ncbi:ferritin-like domain-containing protein [Caenimonas aquaedulcis]|uniref:PA2169 family four-helix-bundle protein n=1 Tax=Caenimonas aquaedulcis TaxID=2793270 RepID=A0A931MIV8_9BURK|nr:PA2169 family four-helix-bundle protein [Caenimonas aquaedulcis]MBG9389675.1 PA2169 family four-helix-bundle protein [Caenimonas aquaedulcis]